MKALGPALGWGLMGAQTGDHQVLPWELSRKGIQCGGTPGPEAGLPGSPPPPTPCLQGCGGLPPPAHGPPPQPKSFLPCHFTKTCSPHPWKHTSSGQSPPNPALQTLPGPQLPVLLQGANNGKGPEGLESTVDGLSSSRLDWGLGGTVRLGQ